jgi:hypothetical protein
VAHHLFSQIPHYHAEVMPRPSIEQHMALGCSCMQTVCSGLHAYA